MLLQEFRRALGNRRRGAGDRRLKPVGVAGFGQQRLGLGDIVAPRRQLDVTVDPRRHRRILLVGVAAPDHLAIGRLVDGEVERGAHPNVAERLLGVVQIDEQAEQRGFVEQGDLRVLFRQLDHFRRHREDELRLPSLQHRQTGAVFGHAAIGHRVDLRQAGDAVMGVFLQLQRVGFPRHQFIRAGAGGMAGEILAPLRDQLRVDDHRAGMGEVGGESAERVFQRDLDRVGINHIGVVDHHIDRLPLEVVGRIAATVETEFHHTGIERRAVGETDAVAQVKDKLGRRRIRLKTFRQSRHQLHVAVEAEQPLMRQTRGGLGNVVVEVLRIQPDDVVGHGDHQVRGMSGNGKSSLHAGPQGCGKQHAWHQTVGHAGSFQALLGETMRELPGGRNGRHWVRIEKFIAI